MQVMGRLLAGVLAAGMGKAGGRGNVVGRGQVADWGEVTGWGENCWNGVLAKGRLLPADGCMSLAGGRSLAGVGSKFLGAAGC